MIPEIIFEDSELIVCRKPSGMAVQSKKVTRMDLENWLLSYLAGSITKVTGTAAKARADRQEIPYLALINRIDQPVEGLVLFARTRKAAAGLSKQLQDGRIIKEYLAVTGKPVFRKEGKLEDYLWKDGRNNCSCVVKKETPGAKKAILFYELLDSLPEEQRSLLRIRLETGRHHQIRVQMANAGMPLWGDRKYAPGSNEDGALALCAWRLLFSHPISGKEMKFMTLPRGEGFRGFSPESIRHIQQ